MSKLIEAIVYGDACLSQERLIAQLDAFQKSGAEFRWRLARPEELRRFLRRQTVVIFPVTQIGEHYIAGVPDRLDLQAAISAQE